MAFATGLEADLVAPGGDEVEPEEGGPYVDELFARIRAERPGRGGGTANALVALAVAAPAEDEPEAENEPALESEVDEDPEVVVLRERDAVLATVERELGRRLKRVLADEQNEVLDLLRRGRSVTFAEVVPAGDEHATASPSPPVPTSTPPRLTEPPVWVPTWSCPATSWPAAWAAPSSIRCACASPAASRTATATWRRWASDCAPSTGRKGQHIGTAVRHYTAAAYAWGAHEGAPDGAKLRWLVDRTGEPCPDADDNALAGPVAKGTPFPTGDAARRRTPAAGAWPCRPTWWTSPERAPRLQQSGG